MKATEREIKILYLLIQGMAKAELFDAIERSAKLTKADAGRLKKMLSRVYAGKPSKIEAARMVKRMTDDELMKYVFGMSKEKLIDAISAGAKLTKADAGRALDATIESIHRKLKVVFGG